MLIARCSKVMPSKVMPSSKYVLSLDMAAVLPRHNHLKSHIPFLGAHFTWYMWSNEDACGVESRKSHANVDWGFCKE